MKKIFVALIAFTLGFQAVAFANTLFDEEFEKELMDCNWQGPGTFKLPLSHSTASIPEGRLIALGDGAKKFSKLTGNFPESSLEAVSLFFDEDVCSTIYFDSFNEGYVSLEDWNEIDAEAFLNSVIENTKAHNKLRRENGIEEMHVIGWIQEPTLDRRTNTVFWAIEAHDDSAEGNTVNSVALRLGRHGYEKLTWVIGREAYLNFGGELDIMLRAHSFDEGYKYTDFTSGDKIASYGIASLVALAVGSKAAKVGGFAGLIILLKKGAGFIFAGIAALFYKFKNIFRSKE